MGCATPKLKCIPNFEINTPQERIPCAILTKFSAFAGRNMSGKILHLEESLNGSGITGVYPLVHFPQIFSVPSGESIF